MIKEISSDGRPTVSSTMTMVTNPADGIPAAPIEAAVAVTLLNRSRYNKQNETKDISMRRHHTIISLLLFSLT